MNRKRVILGVLLGVLAVCLMYAYLATPRLGKAPPKMTSMRQKPSSQEAVQGGERRPQRRLDFAYLASSPEEFAGAKRDIFRFVQDRTMNAPRAPIVQKQGPEAWDAPPPVVPEVVPMATVKKSLSQFTFLGFLEKNGKKTVFLSSGGDLFLAKQGERFGVGQEFLVAQIDNELLKVRHAGREGLIEVKLIEKQKLNAAVSAPVSLSGRGGPVGQPVNLRAFRPQSRTVRPVARQGDQGTQGGVRQGNPDFPGNTQLEAQGSPFDVQQEDQVLPGDGNFWPAKRR